MLLLPVLGQGTSNSNICVIRYCTALHTPDSHQGDDGDEDEEDTTSGSRGNIEQETKMKLLEFVQTSNRSASQTIICIINMCLQSTY